MVEEVERVTLRGGVGGSADDALEAAVTKMMYLLGTYPDDLDHVRKCLGVSLRGEMSEN